eukprot:403333759
MSNLYFLIMALLELQKDISDSNGNPIMLMPLSFVVLVSMIKDIFEDLKRHRSDNFENNLKVLVGNPQSGQFELKKWRDVHVGSATKGICYIETKNLDGETNLKHKQPHKDTIKSTKSDQEILKNFQEAYVECENPNEMLYKFEGTLVLNNMPIPLGIDQMLLRGSSLRNTEWIYGVVVFTGHETKIMRNSVRSQVKFSKLEKATSKYILVIVIMQLTMGLLAALLNSIWEVVQYENFRYIRKDDADKHGFMLNFVIKLGTWVLSLSNIVPISLLVTLECVKFIQAAFIQWDVSIYDLDKDMPTQVQSSNLNEELGTVHYVFSDKTGTLTQNVMEFKKFSAGKFSYGKSNPEVDTIELKNQVEEKEDQIVYNASSPDELALVNAAKFFGYVFMGRDEDSNMVVKVQGIEVKYKLLNVIEFTSTRKRMTVVVRSEDNRIRVMTKGADSIIIPLLKKPSSILDKTTQYLDQYAKEGLRTLLIAEKEVSEEFYQEWNEEYQQALVSSHNREDNVGKIAEKIETDFILIGSTAIEDKLQDDVSGTIKFMKQAGIKVWVLTGDKIETAINIGISCELLNQDMEIFIVDQTSTKHIMLQITQHRRDQKLTELVRENGVIVSGEALIKICRNDRVKEEFLQLAQAAKVVLACRVSPKQKAEIVRMVRAQNPDKTTLSIGDGANDVNMITAAHVGIGISGLEGQQAARSSDYAIGQFKFLKPLLFVHGREAYRRNSYLISYMFYKNVIFVFPIFWYGFISVFSGLFFYESVLYQLYNVQYTALPIMFYALFDFQYTKQEFLTNSRHYKLGFKGKNQSLLLIFLVDECFNKWVFWRWIFYGIWQGALVLFIGFYSMEDVDGSNGKTGSYLTDGQFVYMSVVTLVNLKILNSSNTQSFWSFFFSIASILVFMIEFYILNLFSQDEVYQMWTSVYSHPLFFFALLFVGGALLLVDNGLHLAQYEISQFLELQDQSRQRRIKYMIDRDNAIQRRRITTLSHRGFAFSQEAGQTPQITDNLFGKFTKSIGQKYFFIPKVVHSNQSFSPLQSLDRIKEEEDEQVMKQSFIPDYKPSNENMQHNYFEENKSQSGTGSRITDTDLDDDNNKKASINLY